MPLNTFTTVADVVAHGLCTGCGTCVAVCNRGAIQMKETQSGLLMPVIDPALCNACRLCAKVCPGEHLEEGLLAECVDPFAGPVQAAYLVQHRRPDLLAVAQSGGAVTGLLLHLIKIGSIDHALVTQMPKDGSLRPYPLLTRDSEVIRQTCGSKYCPVALNAELRDVNPGKRIAIVGLPCHLHGVAHLCKHLPVWRRENLLLIGLVCDRILSFRAMDYLVQRSGLCREEIGCLLFRSKHRRGWPGDVLITTRPGKQVHLRANRRIECKDLFTPQRCRLCFDKMNVLADITCGDPHGLSNDRRGQSILLARTLKGLDAVQSSFQAAIFEKQQVSPDTIFTGQAMDRRRKDFQEYVRVWKSRGHCPPTHTDGSSYVRRNSEARVL